MFRSGRLNKEVDKEVARFSESLEDDLRLFNAVIYINIAHARMLSDCEIIGEDDSNKLINSLTKLKKEGFEELDLSPEIEDIHMAVEKYVKKDIGEDIGGKLHTAKSRNDQVSAAIRMVLREEIIELEEVLMSLIDNIIDLAKKNQDTIMPGFTHLQIAEPITFGHYLLSYCGELSRSLERLENSYESTDQCPMGACALAGTSFSIDREKIKDLLGFKKLIKNSIDAVSSRDFVFETIASVSFLMITLSQICEEIVLWNSSEFDMIDIPDDFSSTSSIMPQKKNPDVLELVRAKSGPVLGNFSGGLTILKSLPRAYNLDLQEVTPLLWDSIDEAKSCANIMTKVFSRLEPKVEKMRKNCEKGFPTATELANTLVRNGDVSFRKAHEIVGELSAKLMKKNKEMSDLSLEDLQKVSEKILGEKINISEKEFEKSLNVKNSVFSKKSEGSPSPKLVKKEIKNTKSNLKEQKKLIENRKKNLEKVRKKLEDVE